MATNRLGITVVELIAVMSLIGIMVTIAAPMLDKERFQLNGAALSVGSTFAAQQRNAVMRQHNIVLAFDTTANSMRVHYDLNNDNTVDAGENFSVVELEEGVVFGRGASPARAMSSASISLAGTQDGMPALTFRRNGSSSEEAIIYLTSQRARMFDGTTYAADGRAVEIERATARIRCYSHASGTWEQTC